MNNATTKNRITKYVAIGAALSLLVCSFAFFTDREEHQTDATAGNIDLQWVDTSVKTGSNNEFAQDKVWDNGALVTDGNIINPGDYFDLSYDLNNGGSKSIDVRQKIVLTSSEPLTAANEEYKLTITGGNDTVAVVPSAEESTATKLVYNLADIIIDGSKESEDGAKDGKYTVRLDFAKAAKNAFMDSTVTVDLYVAAMQARNTETSDFPEFTQMASIMTNSAWEDAPVAP